MWIHLGRGQPLEGRGRVMLPQAKDYLELPEAKRCKEGPHLNAAERARPD